MALIVFLRGVNVGGHRTFKPAALARDLAAYDVLNIGAAGTFVVRKTVSQATIRAEFQRRLPFETELMICPAREIVQLSDGALFPPHEDESAEVVRFVTILASPVRTIPPLPLAWPAGAKWQVTCVAVRGRYLFSLYRRTDSRPLNLNLLLEKQFGVAATTRNLKTLVSVGRVLALED